MKKVILSISLLLLLAGCIAPTLQLPTLTAPVLPQTSPPTVTNTPLPILTKTPLPTSTPTQVPTLTRTPVPSSIPNLAATVVATQQPRLYASYPSPDGTWRVDIIIYDCVRIFGGDEAGWNEYAYEQLILVDLASGNERDAEEQLQNCGGLGAFGFDGKYWSTDSRYFYYTTARQGVPDGCGYWESPLFRFDVATLHNETLGWGSRSPDGSKIATWNSTEQAVIIWNINAGESNRFSAFVSDGEIGPITWSPDSQSLVYIQVNSWCPLSGKSYLVLVDLLKPGQTLLLGSESPTFGSVEWDTFNELRLFDENGKEWRYNLLTGELLQVP